MSRAQAIVFTMLSQFSLPHCRCVLRGAVGSIVCPEPHVNGNMMVLHCERRHNRHGNVSWGRNKSVHQNIKAEIQK